MKTDGTQQHVPTLIINPVSDVRPVCEVAAEFGATFCEASDPYTVMHETRLDYCVARVAGVCAEYPSTPEWLFVLAYTAEYAVWVKLSERTRPGECCYLAESYPVGP